MPECKWGNSLAVHLLLSGAGFFGRFEAAIVERAEPAIPGHVDGTVITLEIAVVKLMEENAHLRAFLVGDNQFVEAGMGKDRVYRLGIAMEKHVKWVRRHDQVDQEVSVKEQVLDRVHRDTGPRADVYVSVMQRVGKFVERRPVQCAVDPVKVKAGPDRDQDEPGYKPGRI